MHTLMSVNNKNYKNIKKNYLNSYLPINIIISGRYNYENYLKLIDYKNHKENNLFYTSQNKLNKNIKKQTKTAKDILLLVDNYRAIEPLLEIVNKLQGI